VAQLLRSEWHDSVAREGLAPVAPVATVPELADEPPCPACGVAAGLEAGACRECGLQLE